ncbi:hypothetical protein [Zobellia laminariae]|uniref:hypothetical protein n=1 Tax=Zobellia laminariae TaxID=248906 RepID=UPI0026F42E60|nr:hypothetical protein [Zobellia laminariae]WKX76269.1 hypothetical protein Q5W13_22390 [Zobellia laminariae]
MNYLSIFILTLISLSCKSENKNDELNSSPKSELQLKTMTKTAPSEKLTTLVFKGLDHGVASIEDGNGPLIPFVMIKTGEQMNMSRFMEETLEEGLAQAKKYIVELDEKPELAIIVYDGLITENGKKHDAILVNGYEKNDSKGYCFAQKYKPKKMLSPFKEIGNTVIVNQFESILEK